MAFCFPDYAGEVDVVSDAEVGSMTLAVCIASKMI